MKPISSGSVAARFFRRSDRGFALVISLSLMVLLTVLSVGLLALSAVSLRSSSNGMAMVAARANARMALIMAIGELQKKAGPDQRITASANLIDPSLSQGLTGVWRSWKPDSRAVTESDYREKKSGANFLGYLVSNPDPSATNDSKEAPEGEENARLVGKGSLGNDDAIVETMAPLVPVQGVVPGRPDGGFAWAALDENVKARVNLEPAEEASSLGQQIGGIGSSARNRFDNVKGLEFLESDDEEQLREDLPKLVSMQEAELLSASSSDLARYFHDFSIQSTSLQTNVADGGFKRDLSVLFEGNYRAALPGEFDTKFLYSGTPTPFPSAASNADIRWSLLANYSRLYQLSTSADGSVLTGLKAKLPPGYQLKPVTDNSAAPTATRYELQMAQVKEPVLMPTVIRVDTVFSLVARKAHQGRGSEAYPYMLHLMYLPVITLHNPFSSPLRCTNLQVEFSDIPIGFQFIVNGQPATTAGLVPLNKLFIGSVAKKTFSVTLSNSLSAPTEVVLGPGETRIFGTPFSKDATWASELAVNGAVMFDWANNKTSDVRVTPGMITGPNDGIGFDIDWLAPEPRAPWATGRRNEGVLMLAPTDTIQVMFGPTMPAEAAGTFTITTKLGTLEVGRTQVFYKDQARLTPLLSEGVSPRFPDPRKFPATFPDGGAPLTTTRLLEKDDEPFKNYVNARPFAVFSIGAKTTVESFTKARPLADTGMAYQMATCDFRSTESQGASPLEVALVPVKNGSAAIESDEKKAFFFGGHGSTNGTTAATIYELPLAPLQSIAQLRHANGASLGITPKVT